MPRETSGHVADVLVEIDIFIDHLRGARRLEPGRNRLHYSVITRTELLAGNSATETVNLLLSPFRGIPIDRPVAERAGRLRRETGARLPDALIAATAIEYGLSLATRSRSDFENIRKLRLKNLPDRWPPGSTRTIGDTIW